MVELTASDPLRLRIVDADGNLFRIQTWRYAQTPETGASRFPALVEETTSFYEGTARTAENPPKSTSQTYEYDSLGRVSKRTLTGTGIASPELTTFEWDAAGRILSHTGFYRYGYLAISHRRDGGSINAATLG